MATWTNKQWGALIGGLIVFLIALIGLGATALVVLVAVLGYFVGMFLDGEISAEDIQARAQGRRNGISAEDIQARAQGRRNG
ncbi:MAG: DUF2273 domain-containing protein, partial [Rubrobacteraceae bacterium]